ncbi:unnamed protein product [Camellia sinensis]
MSLSFSFSFMALPQFHFLLLLALISLLSISSSSSTTTIHELLRSHGLPPGLLPNSVKSYTLSDTGLLEVYLDQPCLTKFDTMAFYDSVVKANLTYRSLSGVQGLSQEELFLWLPVVDILVDDPKSGLILFDIGLAHKQLSLSLFEDPRDCKSDQDLDFNGDDITDLVHGCSLTVFKLSVSLCLYLSAKMHALKKCVDEECKEKERVI